MTCRRCSPRNRSARPCASWRSTAGTGCPWYHRTPASWKAGSPARACCRRSPAGSAGRPPGPPARRPPPTGSPPTRRPCSSTRPPRYPATTSPRSPSSGTHRRPGGNWATLAGHSRASRSRCCAPARSARLTRTPPWPPATGSACSSRLRRIPSPRTPNPGARSCHGEDGTTPAARARAGRHRGVDEGRHPLAGGGVRVRCPRRQLPADGRDGVVDLRVLNVHPVHQLRVERGSLAQQGKEQFVFAGVVRVEEVQHLPGVRADDLGPRTVLGRGAEESGELTELAPDDAAARHGSLSSVSAERRRWVGPARVHRVARRARMVSTAVSRGRVSRWTWARRSPPWSAASSVTASDVRLVVDDRLHELVLAEEVVGQLRAADLRCRPDVVEGGAGHAPLVDQRGGGGHDPGAGPLALGRQPAPV